MTPSRARLALLACCFSLFMAQLDATAVNVALPSIGRNLGAGVGGLQWVVDAYVLVLASLAMSGGGIGDRYGRRRIYRAGLSVFSLGSLGCSLAPELPFLVAARMLQAGGAAMLMPVTLSIITNVFRDPASRTRAIGAWIGAAGLAAGIGPLAGGALTASVGWRAIFWINLPIGAIALALTGPLIPESRAAKPRRVGLTGQALLVLALSSLTYALIQAPQNGWHSPRTLALLAVAVISGAAFGVSQARGRYPLIEPRYLRMPSFAGAALAATLAYLAVMGFLFVNSLYLQQVRGMSALAAGLALLPISLAQIVAGPVSGRLTGRYGPRPVLITASAYLIVAMAALTRVTTDSSLPVLAIGYLLIGTGWGLMNPPLTSIAINAMPADQAGVASATVGASRQLGSVLGVAVMGSVVASRVLDTRAGGTHAGTRLAANMAGQRASHAARAAFTLALHPAYGIGLAAVIGLLIVVVIATRREFTVQELYQVLVNRTVICYFRTICRGALLPGGNSMIRHFFLFAAAPGRQAEAEQALNTWLAAALEWPQMRGGAVLRARAREFGDFQPPIAVTYDVESKEAGLALKEAMRAIPNPMAADVAGTEPADQGAVLFAGDAVHDHDHAHGGEAGHRHAAPAHDHLRVPSDGAPKVEFNRGGGLLARLMHAHFEVVSEAAPAGAER